MIREIVTIDEELCDGCGLCVPSCHEGALKIIGGKAKLVADNLCDGLGDCLGHCPQGAIKVERRAADEFDEQAVAAQRPGTAHPQTPTGCPSAGLRVVQPGGAGSHEGGGCPGARMARFFAPSDSAPGTDREASTSQPSQLTHWPVQLHLLPPNAPVLKGAKLLLAADCVPIAYADFHEQMLRGRAVVIACPKLDDTSGYVEKLEAMIRDCELREIVVARMEVPCCAGILQIVLEAHRRAAGTVPIHEIVVSSRGVILQRRQVA